MRRLLVLGLVLFSACNSSDPTSASAPPQGGDTPAVKSPSGAQSAPAFKCGFTADSQNESYVSEPQSYCLDAQNPSVHLKNIPLIQTSDEKAFISSVDLDIESDGPITGLNAAYLITTTDSNGNTLWTLERPSGSGLIAVGDGVASSMSDSTESIVTTVSCLSVSSCDNSQ